MIGNAVDAAFIYANRHWGRAALNSAGWQHIGGGSFRVAFLSPEGVVYKVQRQEEESYQSNLGEWETWKRLYLTCKMPEHSRLPRMGYYPMHDGIGVIVSEYVSGGPRAFGTFTDKSGNLRTWRSVRHAISDATGVGDLYGDNVKIDSNGLMVPVDLGDVW